MTGEEVLTHAGAIVRDRRRTYGEPELLFARVAERWIPGNGREADPGDIGIAAREQVHRALRALGGHDTALGSVAWHVLGCGCSLREWTLRQGWNGRQLRPEQATGVLIAALDLLVVHYGMRARRAA